MDESSSRNKDIVPGRLTRLRERLRGMFPFASGVLAAFLAFFLYNFLFPANQVTETEVNDAIAGALASATPRPPFSVQVYQVIQPSLVWIQSETGGANGETERGLGTGVIIDDAGDILTSLHVVADATKIQVTFADGTQSDAIVISAQPEIDIAVLQAQTMPAQFIPAILGNPGAMQVGDEAFVVGNPFGLHNSMSSGVISGFDRTFQPPNRDEPIEGLIQFDAAANPGSSGGPLLDAQGDVIGIVISIADPGDDNAFAGIAFAVPIGTALGGGTGPGGGPQT